MYRGRARNLWMSGGWEMLPVRGFLSSCLSPWVSLWSWSHLDHKGGLRIEEHMPGRINPDSNLSSTSLRLERYGTFSSWQLESPRINWPITLIVDRWSLIAKCSSTFPGHCSNSQNLAGTYIIVVSPRDGDANYNALVIHEASESVPWNHENSAKLVKDWKDIPDRSASGTIKPSSQHEIQRGRFPPWQALLTTHTYLEFISSPTKGTCSGCKIGIEWSHICKPGDCLYIAILFVTGVKIFAYI